MGRDRGRKKEGFTLTLIWSNQCNSIYVQYKEGACVQVNFSMDIRGRVIEGRSCERYYEGKASAPYIYMASVKSR